MNEDLINSLLVVILSTVTGLSGEVVENRVAFLPFSHLPPSSFLDSTCPGHRQLILTLVDVSDLPGLAVGI